MVNVVYQDSSYHRYMFNGMRYIYTSVSSSIGVGDADPKLFWLENTENELFIYDRVVELKSDFFYLHNQNKRLVAKFVNGEFEIGEGYDVLKNNYDKADNREAIGEFFRVAMESNECIYRLFFFDSTFSECIGRNCRNAEDVPFIVFSNIVNNSLLSLEKIFTSCGRSFFVTNLCQQEMSLQNEKKKLRQVLGLPSSVIEFLRSPSYAGLYPKFKEVAEKKDVNDTVFLVEYIDLMKRTCDKLDVGLSNYSSFIEAVLDISLLTKTSMKNILNYLHSQNYNYSELSGAGFAFPNSEAISMRDYLSIAAKHNVDVDPLPSNLRAAHFYLVNNVSYAEDNEKDKEFIAAVNQYKHLEYSDEKMSVIIPENIAALIDEGMQMHHCIASYVDMICNGAIVLFVRKNENIKESFVSFEITPQGEFIQIKGKFDMDIEETVEESENNEILEFLKKWREEKFENGEEVHDC